MLQNIGSDAAARDIRRSHAQAVSVALGRLLLGERRESLIRATDCPEDYQ